MDSIPNLYLGTSSWSAESWVGPFYPPGTRPADFLPFYATQFRTVEIDSTYYRIPSRKIVEGWRERTPTGFIFAAKFPSEVTHKKLLVDCERETDEFLGVMELLGEKLGALLSMHILIIIMPVLAPAPSRCFNGAGIKRRELCAAARCRAADVHPRASLNLAQGCPSAFSA